MAAIVLLCVMLAPFIGWLDFNASEVQPAVLVLLISSGVLAFMAPRYAWLIALLLGLSIIETHFVALAIGKVPPSRTALPTLLALTPASIGALVGAVARSFRRGATLS